MAATPPLTAPAPLLALRGQVREEGVKVGVEVHHDGVPHGVQEPLRVQHEQHEQPVQWGWDGEGAGLVGTLEAWGLAHL